VDETRELGVVKSFPRVRFAVLVNVRIVYLHMHDDLRLIHHLKLS
jgi:hypothetical protein